MEVILVCGAFRWRTLFSHVISESSCGIYLCTHLFDGGILDARVAEQSAASSEYGFFQDIFGRNAMTIFKGPVLFT